MRNIEGSGAAALSAAVLRQLAYDYKHKKEEFRFQDNKGREKALKRMCEDSLFLEILGIPEDYFVRKVVEYGKKKR